MSIVYTKYVVLMKCVYFYIRAIQDVILFRLRLFIAVLFSTCIDRFPMSSLLSQTIPLEVIRQLAYLLRTRCAVDLTCLPKGRRYKILKQRRSVERTSDYYQE